ncbi:hypothetical protein [Xanthobacter oligotrophicus]|uniref:hypothetical protein n=1 Tax=Xanthobacter oligotrophicus TaxID=2607286 RepID=UPI0011F3FC43|nr:hypothetical protein [Xanthobacter oligotrophicus]MCG5234410.1 hypothetical protein [Xanthobacter oligotrophicus]
MSPPPAKPSPTKPSPAKPSPAKPDALDDLRRITLGLRLDLAAWQLRLALKGGYDPSQPRIPSGAPGGGRWAGGSNDSTGSKPAVAERSISVAARRISPAVEAQCWQQYEADMFHCDMVGLKSCRAQASQRYAACLRGHPIPPLNY